MTEDKIKEIEKHVHFKNGKWFAELEHVTLRSPEKNYGTGTTHYLTVHESPGEALKALRAYCISEGLINVEEPEIPAMTEEKKVKLNRMDNCLYMLHEIGIRKGESVFSNKFWLAVQHDHANGVTKEEAEHFINLVQTAVNSHYDLLEALKRAKSTMERDRNGGYRKDYEGNDAHEVGSTYLMVCAAITKAEQL